MPIRLFSGHRKLIASPRSQQGSHKGVDPREGRQFGSYAESRAGELGGEVKCSRREHPHHETRWSGAERPMKRTNHMSSHLGGFNSGASLGGKVSRYRDKQNIYKQGEPAYTLFYIQSGGVRLSARTKHQPSAVTAILGVHDFFGELCLAGYPLRVSTAVALTASSIRTIKKEKMLQILRKKNKVSNSLVAYLLSSVKSYRDHVADLLTSSAEKRLARVLLRLAHLDKKGPAVVEIPILSQ